MRVEAGDGPNTLLRILVNSKDAGGIIGKVGTMHDDQLNITLPKNGVNLTQ